MVIKMKDLIKGQTDMLREKFIKEESPTQLLPPKKGVPAAQAQVPAQQPAQQPAQGEEPPPESKKLKIDIPDSPFEPDVNQIKDRLKQILKQWQVKEYPSDEYRWKSYYKDVKKIVNILDGEK